VSGLPGGFASAAGTAESDQQDTGYLSDCGIQQIAFEEVWTSSHRVCGQHCEVHCTEELGELACRPSTPEPSNQSKRRVAAEAVGFV